MGPGALRALASRRLVAGGIAVSALACAGCTPRSAPGEDEDLAEAPADLGVPRDLTEAPRDLAMARCDDKVKNGFETDVDCGGQCPKRCAAGKGCRVSSDCDTGSCVSDRCVGPSCDDGQKNGAETDVDCGGACMAKCRPGQGCAKTTDCASLVCAAKVCAAPGCGDGVANGSETDVDCGGGACQPCTAGKRCNAVEDCAKDHLCDPMAGKCVVDFCNDGAKNQKETDIDCGGGLCKGCGFEKACLADTDCLSKMCKLGRCTASGTEVGKLGNVVFYKVMVMGAMTDANCLAACKAAGLTVGCAGPMGCMYSDNLCKVTGEMSCNNPMQGLAQALGCNSPANCAPLSDVFQYMGQKWTNGAACGVVMGQWCAQGNNYMNRWALCVHP